MVKLEYDVCVYAFNHSRVRTNALIQIHHLFIPKSHAIVGRIYDDMCSYYHKNMQHYLGRNYIMVVYVVSCYVG
jgi:hypothetical protein